MLPTSAISGSFSTLAVHAVQENSTSPKEAFFSTLKAQLDDRIGLDIFVPLWKAILRDCEVIQWKEEENNTFRLTLDSAYQAARDDNAEKTWYIEKEILLQLVPENYQVLFPRVKAMHENGEKINPKDKSLNAIWAWESHLGYIYTGVGYSVRWDVEGQIISDNINDAPWLLQSLATPRIKILQDSIQEWNDRGRRQIN